MRLLQEYSLAGSLGNLYKSIEKLNDDYMLPNQSKDAILNPKLGNYGAYVPLLFPNEAVPKVEKLYVCGESLHSYVSDDPKTRCPLCYCKLSKELSYMTGLDATELTAASGGFVKDMVAYMITDDLEVKLWSTVSTLATLSQGGVEENDELDEKDRWE
ncbi:hypothetical protein OSB04_018333 [Centaurea solstitialis]|uniref:Uncharacterized protein n=1 Tax=Centaurea solstitialis TaxID=347529 RepID=A0AA38TPK8_9ASTR|nr:hypothetical protein OSB04_018333 [Centaurea solstitialis]